MNFPPGPSTLRVFSVIVLVITGIVDVSFPRDSLWTYRVSIDNQQSVGPTGPLDTPQNLRISDSSKH